MYTPAAKRIREIPAEYAQLVLDGFGYDTNRRTIAKRKHKLDETFAKLHQLHDELNARLYARPSERPIISSPADAANILKCFIGELDHEEMWVMNLDTRNRVMSLIALYKGSVNSSQVRVGEVFRQAITDNAPSIIVAHNHPSGDSAPSPDDVSVTRAIVAAGKLLDIECLDHLVIAGGKFASLKDRGLGFA
jgi:DNA repair protein RadC